MCAAHAAGDVRADRKRLESSAKVQTPNSTQMCSGALDVLSPAGVGVKWAVQKKSRSRYLERAAFRWYCLDWPRAV